jgi:hypothetical protein
MPRRKTQARLGKQPPRYLFFLNPYTDMRFTSSCPKCEGKTKLRKFPLGIHIEPNHFIVLNKSCRFCPYCELVIAHQDELEQQLAYLFSQRDPEVIGNPYIVVGTVDRADWQGGRRTNPTPLEMFERLHDFKRVLTFERAHYGWGPA